MAAGVLCLGGVCFPQHFGLCLESVLATMWWRCEVPGCTGFTLLAQESRLASRRAAHERAKVHQDALRAHQCVRRGGSRSPPHPVGSDPSEPGEGHPSDSEAEGGSVDTLVPTVPAVCDPLMQWLKRAYASFPWSGTDAVVSPGQFAVRLAALGATQPEDFRALQAEELLALWPPFRSAPVGFAQHALNVIGCRAAAVGE